MTYTVWKSSAGVITLVAGTDPLPPGGESPDLSEVAAYTIEAASWDDAMCEHYRREGWGEYRPLRK